MRMEIKLNPGEAFAVKCDACMGRMFIDGMLCEKCHGDGRITIMSAESLTFSQRAAKEAALIAIAVFVGGMLIAGALRWLGIL
jgi:hypothetical protein